MAKPKFYLEPRPTPDGKQAINMFYSFNGQRLQYYTGIRVDIDQFREECRKSDVIKPIKTTAPNAAAYNKKLKDISTDAIGLVNNAKGENLTVQYIRDQLDLLYKPKPAEPALITVSEATNDFITYFERFRDARETGAKLLPKGKNKGGRYSTNAIKNYNTTLSAIKRYKTYKGLNALLIEDINNTFYSAFTAYCYNVENKEISTFSNYIKDIKTVIGEAAPGQLKNDFIKPGYEADTLALSLEQIDLIHSIDLSDNENFILIDKKKVSYSTLDKVRDLFLIGCYSGLRFSDFSTLKIESVENGFIRLKQTKTGSRVTIPIMQRLQKVLDKYNGGLPASLSNQQFNRLIKEVAKLAGLTHSITVKSTTGGKERFKEQPIYERISSHAARRSYATVMFKVGVPPMLIMSATGHKTESSFLKYIRATNEDKAVILAETLQKLGL
jgi:integrase